MYLVTPNQMRELEKQTDASGVSYDEMMTRAGEGLADRLLKIAQNHDFHEILFLCGNGNNAGDCFVAAQILAAKCSVKVALLCGEPRTDLSCAKFSEMHDIPILTEQNSIHDAVLACDMAVDGVFGIGFHGLLPQNVKEIFESARKKPIVAVDIPSGGNGENGDAALSTPDCIATVTFGAGKIGMMQTPLKEKCGTVHLVEIGVPSKFFDASDYLCALTLDEIRHALPQRPSDSHKGIFGRLLCICGCREMSGAAIMAASAALRCGVGTLCLASVPCVCERLAVTIPEAMTLPLHETSEGKIAADSLSTLLTYAQRCTAVLIGCGIGRSSETDALVENLVKQLTCPIIVDADGLNALSANIDCLQESRTEIILTPHPTEMARLLGTSTTQVQNDRIRAVSVLPSRFSNVTTVLKGHNTLIAAQDRIWLNPTGNSGMSKGGSGDVLAGIIGALTAQGIPSAKSAQIGTFLHGLAGDWAAETYSKTSMLPTDITATLSAVFRMLENDV